MRARLYLFAFVNEFGPLYALYAVWFAESGISATGISWVYLFWAAVGLVAEVPSGALADRVDRRRLIAVALLLRAVGISIWLVWPTFEGILLGAGLWAICLSLTSGTWEALVYDLLTAQGVEDDYAPVMARAGQAGHAAVASGTLLASGMLGLGASIPLLGWLTVALHALSLWAILGLPRAAHAVDPEEDEDEGEAPLTFAAWRETLREGLRVARAHPVRLRLLVVGALLEGLFILDEYQPLLGNARGASAATIPLLVFAVWAGLLLGGELAARRPALRGAVVGGLLIGGAGLTLAALASGTVWALVALGLAYAAQNTAWILNDARFQARTPAHVRATVTSVRALLGAGLNMGAFALVAALSVGDDPTRGMLILVGVLAVTGGLLVRWLPDADPPAAPPPE